MEIDRETIKALSADTRIEILRLLNERRRISAEISKELGLAPSTIVEHLQKLEQAGLIERKETQHKWIYYEITEKGRNLIKPKLPIYIILSLSVGLILTFVGITNIYTTDYFSIQAVQKAAEISAAIPQEKLIPTINWYFVIILAAGLILIILGLVKLRKK